MIQNVLSLFDGMSCGQLALKKAGKPYKNYFASEIDKYAITVAQKNFPETKQLGSVVGVKAKDLPPIDLIIGGSPCQGFSNAGQGLNFEDPRSKLFFEFHRLVEECRAINPKVKFMLENVRMKPEHEAIISNYMKVRPMRFNSSWVSAQNRPRLYWSNIPVLDIPKNERIQLQDILEENVSEKFFLTNTAIQGLIKRKQQHKEKGNGFGYNIPNLEGTTGCLVSRDYKSPLTILKVDREGNTKKNQNKASCLTIGGHGNGNHSDMDVLQIGDRARRFTPVECERLQNVPDNYTAHVSDSQRFRMLGNGWTVGIIAHIFSYL